MHTITLTPPARMHTTTDIRIGSGALQDSLERAQGHDRIVILYDEAIRDIAMKIVLNDCVRIPVESGDASKSLVEVDRIVSLMLDAGCTRKTLLISIGGGMMTDLGGFIGSIFMRGIPSVLVPTTLLAMVDAAIGGKTAVNAGSRKNMIGSITHPSTVLVDTDLLTTLPDAQISEGLSEVIKIAAIIDLPFFMWLEESMPRLLQRDAKTLEECVLRAITAKVNIVQTDEHDREERLLLNFGHTVGHAVEAVSSYKLSHGHSVSIGVVAEMKLAHCTEQERVSALMSQAGLPIEIPPSLTGQDLWTVMLSDKKNENGLVKIAVPKRLGEGVVQTLTKEQFFTLFP